MQDKLTPEVFSYCRDKLESEMRQEDDQVASDISDETLDDMYGQMNKKPDIYSIKEQNKIINFSLGPALRRK